MVVCKCIYDQKNKWCYYEAPSQQATPLEKVLFRLSSAVGTRGKLEPRGKFSDTGIRVKSGSKTIRLQLDPET